MATKKRKVTLDDVWETINSLGVAQKEVREAQKKTEKALQERPQKAQQRRKRPRKGPNGKGLSGDPKGSAKNRSGPKNGKIS